MAGRALAREPSDTDRHPRPAFPRPSAVGFEPQRLGQGEGVPFKVRQFVGKSEEVLRTLSLNGNIELARAAFEAAKRIYPNDRLVLLWGAYVVDDPTVL